MPPSITSLSGTFTDGNDVTLAGTNFGTKSPAKPHCWADFEVDANPTSLGTRTGWDEISNLTRQTDSPAVGLR